MLNEKNQIIDIPETIIYVDTDRVFCTGENNDHPKVYYSIPEEG